MTITPAALDTLCTTRHACRADRPAPVPPEVIAQIITTAEPAPMDVLVDWRG